MITIKQRGTACCGALSLALAFMLLSGCGGPRPLSINLQGTPGQNTNPDAATIDQGNAIVLRIYELSSENNFNGATRDAFWQDDAAALGSERINSQQLRLFPDEQRIIQIDPGEETQFIGIAGDFRFPFEEEWRRIYPVDELRGKRITIEIIKDRLRIDVGR